VAYRPMRHYWVILLKTISDKIFTIPIPQVKPKKILAQYEINDMMNDKYLQSKLNQTNATDKRYNKIEDVIEPTFKRETQKPNDKYKLDFFELDKGGPGFNPYEYQINRRIQNTKTNEGKEYPKMSWEARAFFEKSLLITKQDPTWESEDKNPIMYYIPSRDLPSEVDLPAHKFEPIDQYPTQRFENAQNFEQQNTAVGLESDYQQSDGFTIDMRASLAQGRDTKSNLMALGTMYKGRRTFTKSQMSLAEFKNSQLTKGKKRTEVAGLQNPENTVKQYGFRTRFILNDLFTDKAIAARDARNKQEDIKEQYVPHEFEAFKDPVFRDFDLPFGKKELDLLYKCPLAINPNNLSTLNTKPKIVQNKELKEREALEAQQKEEYEKALQGDKPRPKDLTWTKYHHMPAKLKPMAADLTDEYRPRKVKCVEDPFLLKDQFGDETPLLVMSRQMRENDVFGKPNLQLYFKPVKAADDDLDVEFGRITKKYKTLY
jgi:hypothetical protein